MILKIKKIKSTEQKFIYIPKSSDLKEGDYVKIEKVPDKNV